MFKKLFSWIFITCLMVGFVSGCGGSSDKKDVKATSPDKKVEQPAQKAVAEKPKTIQDKVKIENVQKFEIAAEYEQEPRLGLDFKVINNTDKVMSGVQIYITVKTQFGDELRKLRCNIDSDIPAHGYVMSNPDRRKGWKTNQFITPEVTAVRTPADKLKFDFIINKIVYKDGTTESAGQ